MLLCLALLFFPIFNGAMFSLPYASAWAQGVEEEIEEDVEDAIEEDVEDAIEEEVEDSIEDEVEDAIEQDVEDSVEEDVEDEVENDLEEDVEDEAEDETQDTIDEHLEKLEDEDTDTDTDEEQDDIDEELEANIQQVEDSIMENYERDQNGFYRIRDRLIIFTDKQSLELLQNSGYVIDKQTPLKGLGNILAEVIEPEGVDLSVIRNTQIQVLSAETEIDYNHLYRPNSVFKRRNIVKPNVPSGPVSSHPGILMKIRNTSKLSPKIGLIDSAIDASHSVFNTCNIHAKNFIYEPSAKVLVDHGTAVASIMCGAGKEYQGLLPKMELFAGSVFYNHAALGQQAAVTSLVLALDWLVQIKVPVINMSLSGPPNRVLQAAIQKVTEKDILVVAAAGNAGPASAPLYPAAYRGVVAVTAVNDQLNAYYLANRGNHIDLSAPGVDISHAVPGGLFGQSSGTSFASPFVSVLLATLSLQEQNPKAILKSVLERAQDLGVPGPDPIYGHGLIQALP